MAVITGLEPLSIAPLRATNLVEVPLWVGGLDFWTSRENLPRARRFSTGFLPFHRDFVLCRSFRWQRARRFSWNSPLWRQYHHAIRTAQPIVSRADATPADWTFFKPISDAQPVFRTSLIIR